MRNRAGIATVSFVAVFALSSSYALVRRASLAVVLTAVIALIAAGCAAPGASRLAGTPDDMPPSLAYVPGDSLGWIVADTDAKREATVALQRTLGPDASVVDGILGDVFDDADVATRASWIGPAAGVAMYTLRSGDASRLTFLDIDDRAGAEAALRDAGWKQRAGDGLDAGADEDLVLWTREDATAGSARALGLADDALLATETKPQLAELVAHARRYDAAERPATVEYTIDALRAAPVAIVYRSDAIRADLRTLVRDDAALVELTRWFFQASSVYALRDGWVGVVAAGGARRDTDVRLIGRMDWARAATQVPEPRPVPRAVVDRVPPDARLVVAFDDPGAYLGDLLEAITDGGNEFHTDQDAPAGTPELQPLLDRLDGGASMALLASTVEVAMTTAEPGKLVTDLRAAFERVRIADDVTVRADGDDTIVVTIPLRADVRAIVDGFIDRNDDASDVVANLGSVASTHDAFQTAARPPTPPVGWVYAASSPCDRSRPIAGWITWDTKTQRLAWSIDVPVARVDGGSVRCPLVGTLDGE